jgi:hypothetical protein
MLSIQKKAMGVHQTETLPVQRSLLGDPGQRLLVVPHSVASIPAPRHQQRCAQGRKDAAHAQRLAQAHLTEAVARLRGAFRRALFALRDALGAATRLALFVIVDGVVWRVVEHALVRGRLHLGAGREAAAGCHRWLRDWRRKLRHADRENAVQCSAVRHRVRDKASYSLGAFFACLVLKPAHN